MDVYALYWVVVISWLWWKLRLLSWPYWSVWHRRSTIATSQSTENQECYVGPSCNWALAAGDKKWLNWLLIAAGELWNQIWRTIAWLVTANWRTTSLESDRFQLDNCSSHSWRRHQELGCEGDSIHWVFGWVTITTETISCFSNDSWRS